MSGLRTTVLVLSVACGLPGCSKPWVRPYEWKDQGAALQTLAARAESVKSVQAVCGLTLSSPGGDSVNFDGAIVVQIDEQKKVWLRLRTWKFSQAVFDITVRPDGVWLLASDEAMKRQSQGAAALRPEEMAAAWKFLLGSFFSEPGAEVVDTGGPEFVVRRAEGRVQYAAVVDRATLTVREYTITADGSTLQTLSLSNYRELGPDATPWPMRIVATGPQGVIEVRLDDVELNASLEESVFTPPRRAVKQSGAAQP